MDSDTELNVAVVGLGYIGLPTAAMIARAGAQVLGVDVRQIGGRHDQLAARSISRKSISTAWSRASSRAARCAPRPQIAARRRLRDRGADPVRRGPRARHQLCPRRPRPAIAPVLKAGDVVILESTSPVGTTEKVARPARRAAARPQDARPAPATRPTSRSPIAPSACCPAASSIELIDNDRSIGGITPRCARKALAFYSRFVRGACVTTDARAAEMTKLIENAYRDVNIAFANELSMIADTMGLDVWEVIRLANRHPRVNILSPGPGRRRPLHRGRSLVHRPRRARADAADPHRARSQRRQDRTMSSRRPRR